MENENLLMILLFSVTYYGEKVNIKMRKDLIFLLFP